MNSDSMAGSAKDLVGKAKETAGDATGDRSLQGDGLADQLSGKVQKVVGLGRDAVAGKGPLVDELKRFARERPIVAATVASVVGVALLNTLRGK